MQKVLPRLKSHYNVQESNIFPWKVFTDKDLQLEANEWVSCTKGKHLKQEGVVHFKVDLYVM